MTLLACVFLVLTSLRTIDIPGVCGEFKGRGGQVLAAAAAVVDVAAQRRWVLWDLYIMYIHVGVYIHDCRKS